MTDRLAEIEAQHARALPIRHEDAEWLIEQVRALRETLEEKPILDAAARELGLDSPAAASLEFSSCPHFPFGGSKCVDCTPAASLSLPTTPGDWTEDFEHENGQYFNRCIDCNGSFRGHKRRVKCKRCAGAASLSGTATPTDFSFSPRHGIDAIECDDADCAYCNNTHRNRKKVASSAGTPPETLSDADRLAHIIWESSDHRCELGMDKAPLPWKVARRVADAIIAELRSPKDDAKEFHKAITQDYIRVGSVEEVQVHKLDSGHWMALNALLERRGVKEVRIRKGHLGTYVNVWMQSGDGPFEFEGDTAAEAIAAANAGTPLAAGLRAGGSDNG